MGARSIGLHGGELGVGSVREQPSHAGPFLNFVTSAAEVATSPARSRPRMAGSCMGMRARAAPLRSFQSMGLMLVARTRTRTSFGPKGGSC